MRRTDQCIIVREEDATDRAQCFVLRVLESDSRWKLKGVIQGAATLEQAASVLEMEIVTTSSWVDTSGRQRHHAALRTPGGDVRARIESEPVITGPVTL